MKKALPILLSVIFILGTAPVSFAASPVRVVAESTNPYGVFEGWGTSLCWWAETIGAETEAERREFTKLLFDDEEGLGLNIVRYNVGGGDAPGHNHFREGGNIPVWKDADGVFNPDADPAQLAVLQDAVYFGADTVELFSNSPPYYLTESGCSGGGHDPDKNNIEPENFGSFAEYLAEVTEYIQSSMGIEVASVEPMNEPSTNFWGYEGWQEGCHIDAEDHSALIVALRKALDEKGLGTVAVAAADENSVDRMYRNLSVYTDEALSCLSQINVHTYNGDGSREALREAVSSMGKKLYMSETDGDGSIGYDSGSMGPALWLSRKITSDMSTLRPDAWVLWQAAPASPGMADNSGYWNLCQYDINSNKIELFKKYYAYAHYTKFIRPGDYVLKTDSENVLSARNFETGKAVVVVTNADKRDREYEIDLSSFDNLGKNITVYRTDNTLNLEKLENAALLEGKVLKVDIPKNSITTIVIENDAPSAAGAVGISLTGSASSCFPGGKVQFVCNTDSGSAVTYTAEGGSVDQNGVLTAGDSGAAIVTATIDGTDISASRRIDIINNGNAVRLVNLGSGLAIQEKGDGYVQEGDNDSAYQYWEFNRIGNIASFRNLRSGRLLSDGEGNTEWRLELRQGGYSVINTKTGLALDVYNHSAAEGSKVGTYEYGGGDNQLWNFSHGRLVSVVDELAESNIAHKITPVSINGTAPYGGNETVSYEKAFDGDPQTHHDAWDGDNSYVSAEIPKGETVNLIRFYPRSGFINRMYGGKFYGVRDGEETLLYTVPDTIQSGWNEAYIENDNAYDEIIYRTPSGGLCNVAELEFWSVPFTASLTYNNGLELNIKSYGAVAKLGVMIIYRNSGAVKEVELSLVDISRFGSVSENISLEENYESADVYVTFGREIISSGYIYLSKGTDTI